MNFMGHHLEWKPYLNDKRIRLRKAKELDFCEVLMQGGEEW
jgi:hypothetical protein